MNVQQYLDQILGILSAVRSDKERLDRILKFLQADILPELLAEKEETITLPEKYEAVVNRIAQSISCKLICHLNMDTLEIEEHLENEEPFFDEDEEVDEEEEFIFKHVLWERSLTINPLESSESFEIMAGFTEQLPNGKVKNILTDILNNKKPFAHFNSFIHNSSYKEDWFKFKNTAYDNHVRQMIYDELNNISR